MKKRLISALIGGALLGLVLTWITLGRPRVRGQGQAPVQG